jgi:hypothetical protein
MLFRVWFTGRVSDAAATQAAAGWGGDRLVAYAAEGESLPAVVVLSVWDSEQDADEAEQAARKLVLSLTSPPPAPSPGHGREHGKAHEPGRESAKELGKASGPLVRTTGGRGYATMRRGRLLAIVCGVPEGREAGTANEMLRTWQVSWPAARGGSP